MPFLPQGFPLTQSTCSLSYHYNDENAKLIIKFDNYYRKKIRFFKEH